MSVTLLKESIEWKLNEDSSCSATKAFSVNDFELSTKIRRIDRTLHAQLQNETHDPGILYPSNTESFQSEKVITVTKEKKKISLVNPVKLILTTMDDPRSCNVMPHKSARPAF